MTIFFASNQADDFIISDVTRVFDSITNGSFDSNVVSNSVGVNGSGHWLQTPNFGPLNSFWTHFERARDSTNNSEVLIAFNDVAGNAVLRERFNASSSIAQFEAWNGSAWISVGGTFTDPTVTNPPAKIDIRVVIQTVPTASTSVEFYYNGSLLNSGTVSFAISSISSLRVTGSFSNNTNRYSQFIISDEPTINMRFYHRPPTAPGASQDFSGTFVNIDEPVLDVSDFISTSNSNAVSTFTAPARTFAGFAIRAVVVSANARRGINGPQSIQLAVRQGGVDYYGPTIPLTLGFAKYTRLMELNPATSLPWTDSEAASAALEFGVKSIT